jgi:hypothetical protein
MSFNDFNDHDNNDIYSLNHESESETSPKHFLDRSTTDSNAGRFLFHEDDDNSHLAELSGSPSNCTFNGTQFFFVFSEADSTVAWFVFFKNLKIIFFRCTPPGVPPHGSNPPRSNPPRSNPPSE